MHELRIPARRYNGAAGLCPPCFAGPGRALATSTSIEYGPLRRVALVCEYWTTQYQRTRVSDIQNNSYKHFTLVAWKDDTLRHREMCEIGLRNRRDTSAGTTSCSSTQSKRKSQGEYKSRGSQILAMSEGVGKKRNKV